MPVQFDEEQSVQTYREAPIERGIIGFLIRKGIVKGKAQANVLLIGVIIVLLLITIFFVTGTGGETGGIEPVEGVDPETGEPLD